MGDLVRKRNEVIRASYRLTPNEQAIILSAISQIDHDKNISDQEMYELNVRDLAKLTETNIDNAYRDFKEASTSLYRRELMLKHNNNNRLTRWVQTIEYNNGNGTILIQFSNQILPYLTNIRENFTSYNLRHVAKFKSTYGVRLYELLKQWRNKSTIDISIAELKEMFLLGDSYPLTSELKRRVLDAAVKDINKYSDLTTSYENIKNGRKITGFRFKFKTKKQPLTNDFIEKNARVGESWEDARKRLTKTN